MLAKAKLAEENRAEAGRARVGPASSSSGGDGDARVVGRSGKVYQGRRPRLSNGTA